ncbi:unnamed protein product [Moneuplotes crassus]|uniref:Sidoreflexin n=1 Tax=Euplotes crassus TaxID=5936 RepID=A0AAD2CYG1_EUPCR|nr:unnamed protein product [Moneuplotes crassus]
MIENSKETLMPFDINSPEYPQDTYIGRVLNLLKSQNPFNFYLPHSKVMKAKDIVDTEIRLAKELNGSEILYSPEKIKEIRIAQSIVNSSFHPETGEIVPRFFRLCSYASVSVPVIFGMLLCKPTTLNIIFWQWLNQTYSAGMNFANRNASSTLTTKEILTAYGVAVSTSIGIGLGVKALLNPLAKNLKGPSQIFINFLITLSAVGSAGFLNLLIMRSKEIKDGISLIDNEGNDRGKSKIIGKSAVINTALTRFIMPIPPLIVPTVLFYFIENNLKKRHRLVKLGVEIGTFFACLSFGPPIACGLFEQNIKAHISGLEPEFQNLKDSHGNQVTELWYNKGL